MNAETARHALFAFNGSQVKPITEMLNPTTRAKQDRAFQDPQTGLTLKCLGAPSLAATQESTR